jgi:dimethylamine/trimethylamine dehydrogenase
VASSILLVVLVLQLQILYLPKKIEEGRIEDIRECIGCNICISADMTMSISRCTQNPTFMEEWGKSWHPERLQEKGRSDSVLVVGSGPAGLEASRVLGRRGYQVILAEASTHLGGRVAREKQLPGLSAWGRGADYRAYQLSQMSNIDIYLDNALSAVDILEFGSQHVVLATGSSWRNDGVARFHINPMPSDQSVPVYTPDDIMDSRYPEGHVILFDDDHYYIGGVIAEALVDKCVTVTLVTTAAYVSEWTNNTREQATIHRRLAEMGVDIVLNRGVSEIRDNKVISKCVFTDLTRDPDASAVVLVTSRIGSNQLWIGLENRSEDWKDFGIESIKLIVDAESPAPIAWATYAGYRYACELDMPDIGDDLPFRCEVAQLKSN